MRNFALSLSIFLIFGLSGCGIKNDAQNNIYGNQARYYENDTNFSNNMYDLLEFVGFTLELTFRVVLPIILRHYR
jgi:hypothetical protein